MDVFYTAVRDFSGEPINGNTLLMLWEHMLSSLLCQVHEALVLV